MGVSFRLPKPVGDCVAEFNEALATADHGVVTFSCNCILNYVLSKLEGQRTEHFAGPIMLGEIAYQLQNQTMVFLTVTSTI